MAVIRSQCKNDEEYLQALRDDFAAAAIHGLMYLVAHDAHDAAKSHEGAAKEAYALADAMLAEREKNNVA